MAIESGLSTTDIPAFFTPSDTVSGPAEIDKADRLIVDHQSRAMSACPGTVATSATLGASSMLGRKWICIAVICSTAWGVPEVLATTQPIAVSVDDVAGGRKSVTVFARNAASASAKATNQNPGWSVVSVKKVNDDPKSMAYRVVMKK